MQIYFSEVPQEYAEGECFESEGKEYYYSLDIYEDSFSIADTCGRSVPLGFTDVKHLINALIAADYYTAPIVHAEKTIEKINSDLVIAV